MIKAGYQVVGTDKNKDIVESVNSCNVSTNEPGLHNAVRDYVESGLLTCSTEPEAADVYIICVPTPIDSCTTSKAPDLSHIYDVISNIAPLIKARDFIIIESTCPVGTLSSIRSYMKNLEVDVDSIHLAQCPERVLPGQIMRELVENDRIVGGFNNNDTKLVADFYRTFVKGDVLETNAQTAELCKLAENSFRDVNIAFANELSIICEKEDINIYELINIANRHPRVNILQPGPGVGGHCIAVDPWFIVTKNESLAPLIKKAREVNDAKPSWVLSKILKAVENYRHQHDEEPKIACFGLSFKPDVDDLRESPSLAIALALKAAQLDVVAVEPNISHHKDLTLKAVNDAIKESSLVVFLVRHKQFISIVRDGKLKHSVVLDFCGILDDFNCS